MAVEMAGIYTGNLRMELTHGPSGSVIRTAAPVDNKGDGSSFSPTDLVAAGLAACMVTTMAIVAEREAIPFGEARLSLEKHMVSDPRRIGRVPVRIEMPAGLTPEQRRKLETAAHACPVKRSLDGTLDAPVEFVYPD